MARFSLGREEDDADEATGSSRSRPTPKRQKLRITQSAQPPPPPPPPPPPQQPPSAVNGQVVPSELIEEEEDEDEESEYEIEAEEEESEYDDEEEDDDEQVEEELENHHRHRQEQQQSPELETSEEPNRDGPISVTLTDPDVLDCPICLEPLSIPVFQCENGHIACSGCCTKIRNKCPSCSWPIGYNRCRAMEKVLESVKVFCRNKKYGCKETVKYSNKHEHENTCILAPCLCPILDCNYVGSSWEFYSHFSLRHSTSAKNFLFNHLFTVCLEKSQRYLILRETNEAIIFILKHFSEHNGSAIKVVRIAPSSSSTRFSYHVRAREGDTSIVLQSSVESIPKLVDCPPVKKFLLVPNHYSSSCGQLNLELCILKHQTSRLTPADMNISPYNWS